MSQACALCGSKLFCDVEDAAFDVHVLKCVSTAAGLPPPPTGTMSAQEMKVMCDRLLTQLGSAVEVRLLTLSGDTSLDDALQKSVFNEMVKKLSMKQLLKIQSGLYSQLDNLKACLAQREDPSLDTFLRGMPSPMMMPRRTTLVEDDPFYNQDTQDVDATRSPLPRDPLVVVCQFLGHSRGFYSSLRVNRFWHAVCLGDPVWQLLCITRYGDKFDDTPRPWRTTYFLGTCRSLMVTLQGGTSVSLPVSIGTTVRDLLAVLGIPESAAAQCSIESDDFSKSLAYRIIDRHAEASEYELRCSWIMRAHLHVLFDSPYSVARLDVGGPPMDVGAWQSAVLNAWQATSLRAYKAAPEFIRNVTGPP